MMFGDHMFERYTDRARRSVVLAQSEARDLRHPEVDVDHLLLGVAAEGEGVAFQALDRCGVSAAAIRAEISLRLCQVAVAASPATIPFTSQAGRALEYASRGALQLGCSYVGTEHMLLGLLRDAEDTAERPVGPVAAALMACGNVTAGEVRDAVMTLLRGYAEHEKRQAPAYRISELKPPEGETGDFAADLRAWMRSVDRRLEAIRRHLGVPE